jgi:Vam6/Vps39-like protein vacuolar protein sorting-associated protein 39
MALSSLSAKEEDEEKLGPTVRYLQKLGPEYLQTIFEASKWVFGVNPNTAFQV